MTRSLIPTRGETGSVYDRCYGFEVLSTVDRGKLDEMLERTWEAIVSLDVPDLAAVLSHKVDVKLLS